MLEVAWHPEGTGYHSMEGPFLKVKTTVLSKSFIHLKVLLQTLFF